ncbi:MAG: M20 family metallopeptidase [Bacilli bacterium]|nr:M20 family metallopeptidase [Bacilli bacterium]
MNRNLIIKQHNFNSFSSLIISNTKDENFDVVFCVHIDVVPCDKYQFQKERNTIYGRGTIDMKGAVSVCITLFNH